MMLKLDLKSAVRSLLRSWGQTLVAVVSLGLAIGATSSGLSIVNALFARDIAIAQPQQLVAITRVDPDHPNDRNPMLLSQFEALRARDQQHLFAQLFAWRDVLLRNLEANGVRYLSSVNEVSGDYFTALGVPPYLGRVFDARDVITTGASGSARVAVLDYRCWTQRYGSDPQVLGKVIVVDNIPLTIIGVMPPRFTGLNIVQAADATVPIGFESGQRADGSRAATPSPNYYVAGRLQPGVTLEQALPFLQSAWPSVLEETVPANFQAPQRRRFLAARVTAESLRTGWAGGSFGLRRDLQGPMTKLLGLSGLVLLVAFVNLAGLILARISTRRQEFGLRASLGAGRLALARVAILEAILTTLTGAVLGLVTAFWTAPFVLRSFLRSAPLKPMVFDATPDARVLILCVTAAVILGVLCALGPTWNLIGRDPLAVLRQNTRTTRGGLTIFQKGLVCVQLCLAFILTTSALLFGRSLYNLQALEPGFRASGTITMELIQQVQQRVIPDRTAYFKDLSETLAGVPGVDAVSFALVAPLDQPFSTPVSGMDGGPATEAVIDPVGPNFFHTLGIRLLNGRDFEWHDDEHAAKVAIISDSAAAELFPGKNPLGQKLEIPAMGFASGTQIVGVVDSASLWKLRATRPKAIYLASMQMPVISAMAVVVHGTADSAGLIHALTQAVESKHYHYAFRTQSLPQRLQYALVDERVLSMFSLFFAALTILLASAGLYGLLSYAVSRRTAEFGIRVAIGAQRHEVIRLVMRDALWILLWSCVIGGPLAILLFRLTADVLFGLSAHDPLTYLGSAAILAAFTLVAAYVPGRRASRIDPIQALRID